MPPSKAMTDKKHPPRRTVTDAKAAADQHWQKVNQGIARGIVDRDAIVQAMSWLNDIDGEEMQKRESDYMQRRKKWLIDPDAPSVDEELEKNYQCLRDNNIKPSM